MFSSSKKFKNFRNFPNMRILKINSGFHCNEFPVIEVVQVNANGCDTRDSYLQLKIVSVSFPLRVYHLPNKTSPDSFIFVNPCNSMYYASNSLSFALPLQMLYYPILSITVSALQTSSYL